MLIVHVHVQVLPEYIDAFRLATMHNARHSLHEAGVIRFDVLQQSDDPTRFILMEIYRDAEAPLRHKETAHYAQWRDTVAPMMAAPRSARRYEAVYPESERWETPAEAQP